MLLVKTPTREVLLAVLDGVLTGLRSRDEVFSWYKALFELHGWELPLSVGEGYWYFYSLACITLADNGYADSHFIRPSDLQEYIQDINQVPYQITINGVQRLRSFQINLAQIQWPLTVYRSQPGNTLLDKGLRPVRGIFEQGQDLVEHIHLRFEGKCYLIIKQFDAFSDDMMILGESRDKLRLQRFIDALDLC
ncbi:MAG: hypothetical protein KUG79_13570 [Pseudomonadales bacterium]|nr:hypothetical protein [Pseudomonadales bacterium]